MTGNPRNGKDMIVPSFKILGIQQIAIGSLEKEKNLHLWKTLFGLQEIGSYKNLAQNVDETMLAIGTAEFHAEIDIMKPIDPEAHPAIHTHPLHHIGLWVDNLQAAIDFLKENGVRFVSDIPAKGARGHDVVFIHPRSNAEFPIAGEGVLIELIQYPNQEYAK